MITLTRGRKQTTKERREAYKDKLIGKLEQKVWQHKSRMNPQVARELEIIMERLQDVRSEEVNDACRRYTNVWL